LFFWSSTGNLENAVQLSGSVNGQTVSVEVTTGGAGFVGTLSCFDQGTCGDDPCGLLQCNAVPSPTCIDSRRSRQFEAPGICNASDGACAYTSKVVQCGAGCNAQTGKCFPSFETLKNVTSCVGSHTCPTDVASTGVFAECFTSSLESGFSLSAVKYSLAQGTTPAPSGVTLFVYAWDGAGEPGALINSIDYTAPTLASAGEHTVGGSQTVLSSKNFCVGLGFAPAGSTAMRRGSGYVLGGRTFSHCDDVGDWAAGPSAPTGGNYCIEATVRIPTITSGR